MESWWTCRNATDDRFPRIAGLRGRCIGNDGWIITREGKRTMHGWRSRLALSRSLIISIRNAWRAASNLLRQWSNYFLPCSDNSNTRSLYIKRRIWSIVSQHNGYYGMRGNACVVCRATVSTALIPRESLLGSFPNLRSVLPLFTVRICFSTRLSNPLAALLNVNDFYRQTVARVNLLLASSAHLWSNSFLRIEVSVLNINRNESGVSAKLRVETLHGIFIWISSILKMCCFPSASTVKQIREDKI